MRAGRVTLEGEVLREGDRRVDPHRVQIDGQPVEAPDGLLVMLHKPAGVVCSRDEREGPSVFELLPGRWSQRNPPMTAVGRLDKDTTGLLLLTDLGEWVHRWTSPKHHLTKTYEVAFEGKPPEGVVDWFAAGTLVLEGERKPCQPAALELVATGRARLHLTEGKYHQVRRMFAAAGMRVLRLHRSRFGDYELGDLAEGAWRQLELPGCAG